jgi:hypothetical protein
MPPTTTSRMAVGLLGALLAASGLTGCGGDRPARPPRRPPARGFVPDGYGDTGFQASGVDFPTEGCWEVTGALPTTRLRFVTLVVKKRA